MKKLEMESTLEFMYLGETKIDEQERKNKRVIGCCSEFGNQGNKRMKMSKYENMSRLLYEHVTSACDLAM